MRRPKKRKKPITIGSAMFTCALCGARLMNGELRSHRVKEHGATTEKRGSGKEAQI